MNRLMRWLGGGLAAIAVLPVLAADSDAVWSVVGRCASPPVVDGCRDAVYDRALPLGGFAFRNTMQFAWAWTEIRLVHDGVFLYGHATCCQKDGRELVEKGEDAGNSLDLYFLTDDGLHEYCFGPSGGVRAAVARQDDANVWIQEKTAASAVRASVTAEADDRWCVEFVIPLSELRGGSWRFNARRLRPGQMQSFWQRQDTDSCWRPQAAFGRLDLTDEDVGDLAFGAFPKFQSTGRFEKTVTNAAGRVVYRYFYEYPRASFVKIEPSNLDHGVLHLDGGELGLESRLTWKSRHNYPGGEKTDGRAVPVPLTIRFKVPCGVTVVGAAVVSSNGQNVVFEQVSPYSYGLDHYLKTRFSCSLPVGSAGTISYATRYRDGGEATRTMPFRVAAVRPARPPSRFSTGFYHLFVDSIDEARKWARIGVNTFSVRGFGERQAALGRELLAAGFLVRRGDYFWPGAEPNQSDAFNDWGSRDEAARALDIDLKPIRNGHGYQLSPSYRGRLLDEAVAKEGRFLAASGISWCAFDLEGYIQRFGEKGDYRPETVAAFKRNWSLAHPDVPAPEPCAFERTPLENQEAHRIWVETKCELWGGFFRELKSRLAESAGRPVLFSEWSMNAMESIERRNHSLRGEGFFRAFDFIELDTYAGIDRDLRQLAFKTKAYRREFPDVPLNVILTPSPHRLGLAEGPGTHYWTTAPAVADEIVCTFKEAATMGAKGVYAFHFNEADVECLRQFSEGVRLVGSVEDIVLDGVDVVLPNDGGTFSIEDNFFGKRAVWKDEPRVFTRGRRLGDKMLVSVSEYREQGRQEVGVSCTFAKRVCARDVETKEILGAYGPGECTVRVVLEGGRRCRLLMFEPHYGEDADE